MFGLLRSVLLLFIVLVCSVHAAESPSLTLLPASLSFTLQSLGKVGNSQTITLSNKGNAPLDIQSFTPTGDFTQSNDCGTRLGLGGLCTVTVIFTPTATGIRKGFLSIVSNATGSPHTAALIGNATYDKTYSDNGNGTLTDPTTGLTWMRCGMGQTWTDIACTSEFTSYDWVQARDLKVTYANQSDWRLPNVRELSTLIEASNNYYNLPSILPHWYNYWTSSPYASDASSVWMVTSTSPFLTNKFQNTGMVVMVRGEPSSALLTLSRPSTDYEVHTDGTVTHTPTGLIWKRCLQGQTWNGSTCDGEATLLTWEKANALVGTVMFASQDDWRLPRLDELQSLVDYTLPPPSVNGDIFTSAWALWSSYQDPWYGGAKWYVDFGKLSTVRGSTSDAHAVRLVRNGKFPSPATLTVTKSGVGTVRSTLADIDCGDTCTYHYTPGTLVTLTAIPAQNLIAWDGDCTGAQATCTVTMSAAKTVTARFKDMPQIPYLPDALTFSQTDINSTSLPQPVILTNSGTLVMTVSITTTGDFSQSNDCGSNLNAGAYCTINVFFTPTVMAIRTGALSVASNAPGSPHVIKLSGSAVDGVVTYSDNGDGTVTDPLTGLTWMRCSMGQNWDGSTCTGDAKTYTWLQTDSLKGTEFAQKNDWRVPTVRELTTLVDKSISHPAIDRNAFPNTPSVEYWTNTPYVGGATQAWNIQFNDGFTNFGEKSSALAVRMVRGDASSRLLALSPLSTDYEVRGDGTATHIPTGLVWKRCVEGQSWNGSTCTGTGDTFTFEQVKAKNGAETFAGTTDWRLPTANELQSLVDFNSIDPSINRTAFPATPPRADLWSISQGSSSIYYCGGHCYSYDYYYSWWHVYFGFGLAGIINDTSVSYGVRLVRGGKSLTPVSLAVTVTGTGTVSSLVAGMDCHEATCTNSYVKGTRVILTAAPVGNLVAWGGACSGADATCIVTLDEARTVRATFKSVPVISELPASLTFPTAQINDVSSPQPITLTNSGGAVLDISITMAGDFTQTNDCGARLNAGKSCQIDIAFTPTAVGLRNGSLSIASNAAGTPHGVALSGNAVQPSTTYSDSTNGTATDPVTGLTWMRCSLGQTWDGSTCLGTVSNYTWAQVEVLPIPMTFAEHSDWRLPTIRELASIVDASVLNPAINRKTFPTTPNYVNYWSNSPVVGDNAARWSISFRIGAAEYLYSGEYYTGGIRLVRGDGSSHLLRLARPSEDYDVHTDGTVSHTPTGLTWKRCLEGQSWNGSTCTGDFLTFTWNNAIVRAEEATFASKNDWRMPNMDEASTLIDYTRSNPLVNDDIFPFVNQQYYGFWSGSPTGSQLKYELNGRIYDVTGYGDFVALRLVRSERPLASYALTIFKSGDGTISSTGIDCGTVCSNSFASGTQVTLTAAPAQNLVAWNGACTGSAATCTVTLDQAKTVTASFQGTSDLSNTLNLTTGWNLLGNGVNAPLDVATAFGDANKVTTVWKWQRDETAPQGQWAFFTPNSSTTTDHGAAYAASKGYVPLTTVSAGEGFWVNAKTALTAQLSEGTTLLSSAFPSRLQNHWNLVAIGDKKTPREFNNALGSGASGNFISLWAWNSVSKNWYFYAPSLDSDGTLSNVLSSKGYLSFGLGVLTPTTGFWVNKP